MKPIKVWVTEDSIKEEVVDEIENEIDDVDCNQTNSAQVKEECDSDNNDSSTIANENDLAGLMKEEENFEEELTIKEEPLDDREIDIRTIRKRKKRKLNSSIGRSEPKQKFVRTTLDIDRFISELEDRPAIWDVRCKEYNHKTAKTKAWEEMCDIFVSGFGEMDSVGKNNAAVVLQKKWKNIRDHYRKECARRKTEKSGSGASSAKKEYIYYSQLSFLSSTVETRPQKSSDKVEEDTDVQTARSECSQDLPKIQAKKKKVSHEDSLIGALSANIYKQIQEPKEDADKDFLMSLLPYVKSAPDSAKLECRCEIMQVLKKYNTPSINPMQYAPYPKRLTSDKLLSACLLGKTQNDSGIRCSKDEAGVSRAGADGVIGLGDCEPQVYVDVAEDPKDSIRGKHAMSDTEEHSASDRRKLIKIEDDTDVKIDISKEHIYVETNEEFILPNRNEPMDTSFYIKQEPDDSGRVKQEPDDSGRVKQEPDDSGRLYIKQEPGDSGTV